MKIFILSDISSTHTKRWVKSLSESNVEVFLFGLLKCDESFYSHLQNVTVFNYNFSFQTQSVLARWVLGKVLYFKSLKSIRQKIKDFQPDIVHAHYASSYGLLGALAGFHPFIVSVWGSDVYCYPKAGSIYKKLLKFTLRRADLVLSTSRCMAAETNLYTSKKIGITPFGVDSEFFHPKASDFHHSIVVGTVKTLSKNYGIDLLIRAFAQVVRQNPEKDLLLQIVGDGPEKENLQNLCRELQIMPKVQFKGFVVNEKLPQVYRGIDIFVALSFSESFGVVAVEAMSCGCPVIASDAEGFCEVIKNGETGIIVPRNNPEAAAQAIQSLIDHPEKRQQMGEAGRQHVQQCYDWNKNVETMIHFYHQLLQQNSKLNVKSKSF
ncbi:MAG: glycosyltransferase [Bacteroidales bacterium]|nr:glycosyltransferase [Bacteroidales bacterium]